MRIEIKEIKIYKFDEASRELKDKIIENFDCEGFIYEHCMSERIDTLKKLAMYLNLELDYSISCVPSRGEFIKFDTKNDDVDNLWGDLKELSKQDCPLTGCCYDHDLLDYFKIDNGHYEAIDALNEAASKYIESIHKEYESMLTDEYIRNMCESNEYEFTEDGKLY